MHRGLCGESRGQAEPALWFPYRPQGMCRGPAPLVRGRWRSLPREGNAPGQSAFAGAAGSQAARAKGGDVNIGVVGLPKPAQANACDPRPTPAGLFCADPRQSRRG